MLKKIREVKGIGLFHGANGHLHKLQKASLIYADNGQGKSTLVSLLRSCATNKPELLLHRRTIKGSNEQEVDLEFSDGQRSKFKGGSWDVKRPEILIFDADFVEKNVYAGGQVTPEQRKNLLHFVIGQDAVVAQKEYDNADNNAKIAATTVSETIQKLSGIHKGLTLEKFQGIAEVPDADNQIIALNKKIDEEKGREMIQSQKLPLQLVEPTFKVESIFNILDKSFVGIGSTAEQQVKDHLNTHNIPQLEKWISDGLTYGDKGNCLFCNQSLKGVSLIQAYRSYFNQDYKQLKFDVAQLDSHINRICSKEIIYKLKSQFDAAKACIDVWQKYTEITTPVFDEDIVRNALANIHNLLERLKQTKEAKLLESVDSEEDRGEIFREWQTIVGVIATCNDSISNAIKSINEYKDNLAKLDSKDLLQKIDDLKLAKIRYQKNAIDLLEQVVVEESRKKEAHKEKERKREELDKILKETFERYKDNINGILNNCGTRFCISEMSFNYLGDLRSKYTLQIRDKDIDLSVGAPDFKTSLSEGDKRALAFAFFISSARSKPDLANKIIVIDDPMCSLDSNRRRQTCIELKKLHDNCKQMIVLAHDMYFLQEFYGELYNKYSNNNLNNIKCLKLKTVDDDYSDFDSLDIEQECKSEYFKYHLILREYIEGRKILDKREVAKSIRLMLEGYLHKRFPNLISDSLLFGQMIDYIKKSQPPSPLVNAHKIVDELNEINSYAKNFHHDNPKANQVQIVDSELRTFVKRALEVVYAGEVKYPKT